MADAFWIETIACPRCRVSLDSPFRCDRCLTAYPAEDGVPRLVASGVSCEVRFDYTPDVHVSGDLLDRVLADPPRYAGSDCLPYHLDTGHARRIAELPARGRILEIGCGGGQNRQWVEGRGHQYVGTDVSRTRVFEWLQRYGGPDLLCDAHFLPFLNGQFDIVYSAATTEHLSCPQRVVQEVFRVLKPGGYFLSNVSFLEPWHDNSYYHMTPLGVIELLSRAGFDIEYVWPGRGYSGFQALAAMTFRWPFRALRHLGRAVHGLYRVQNALRNMSRWRRGLTVDPLIRRRAIVAGAIDWIARRPVADTPLEGGSPR